MSVNITSLCMNCMGELDENGVCKSCRASAVPPNDPQFLPQYTLLDNHYCVGRVLRTNGESTIYLAYNTYTDTAVEVREYFPTALADRLGYTVQPRAEVEIQYKAILSDFTDLHRALMRLRTVPILVPILDIFEANNTVYVVSQIFGGIRFGDFLNINVGELTWEQTRGFLMPLLMSVQYLHDANIYHRGISPDTLLINRSGELKLVDFCLPAVRTAKCELIPELYGGYAAPEQYKTTGWHGTWTDVYAVAAVMYKTLTGTMPPNAGTRLDGERLFAVSGLNASVPQHVSDILDEALAVDPNDRIKTIDELRARLAETQEGGETEGDTKRVASKTMPTPAAEPAVDPRVDRYIRYARRRRRKRPHYGLLTGILGTLVMCSAVLYILSGMYENRQQLKAATSSSVVSVAASEYAGSIPVPDFVGVDIEVATKDANYKGKVSFSIIYEANADYVEGVIFEQSPKDGEMMEVGGILNVKVSKGVQTVKMPAVVGETQEVAIELLELLEIDYEIIPVYEDSVEKGEVARTNYEEGALITLARDVVFLFVNQQDKVESAEVDSSTDGSSAPGFFGPAD